jgi:hypothetical protein
MARWVLPVVLFVAIATAAGALVARPLYTQPGASPAAVLPNEDPIPPGQQPGDRTVAATKDAAEHPLYEEIHQALQTFFDAVNTRDYNRWLTVVTKNRATKELEPAWRRNYRSTQDGSIVVHRIETGPDDTARVLLSFTSVQDPKDAPVELAEPCIRWRLVWPFVFENDAWKLDAGVTNTAPQHDRC